MSDLSSQFAPQVALLLTPGQQGGQGPFRPLQPSAGGPSPLPADGLESSQSVASPDFEETLQALLSRVEQGEAGTGQPVLRGIAGSVEVLVNGDTPDPGGSPGRVPDPVAAALTGNTAPAGGNILPSGGKVLPLSDAPVAPAPPSRSELQLKKAVEVSQLRPAAAGASGPAAADAGADATERAVARDFVSRVVSGDLPAASAAAASKVTQPADAAAVSRGSNAAPVAPLVFDSVRQGPAITDNRLKLAADGRSVATGSSELPRGSIGELLAARADAARVTAAADSASAQFNLGARPLDGGLIFGQTVSGESALRDLQSMMPLRPQSGEAGQAFAKGLGQRLVMMAENGIESARLRLSPANLGPLDIQISLDEDRAQVTFGATHAATRDALESALPRLRELFAAQGLELTDANVDDRGATEREAQSSAAASDDQAGLGLSGRPSDEESGASALLWTDGSRALDIFV